MAREERISSAPAAAAPGAVATSPSGCASPWIAVGATATGERTGVPSTVVAVDDLVDPGQHPRVQLPVRPRRHVALQQPLVVGPAGVVGVGHLPDGPPGLVLQVLQVEVGDQGCRRGRPPGLVGLGVVSRVPVLAG